MAFLYHAIPDNFRGTTIYPLNQMKNVYPDVYEERVKLYAWRKQVMEQRVYPLDCLWNDCVFMMAADPIEVNRTMRNLGFKGKFPRRFWQIDPGLLEVARTTIYNFGHFKLSPPEDFLPFSVEGLDEYAVVPRRTIEYWRSKIEERAPTLMLYLYIPHILYKGTIETADLAVIEIEESL